MKSFKIIESIVIGFLIGVVVSVYILFMDTATRDIGTILKTISLNSLISYFPAQYSNSIIFNFLFYICVYVVYAVVLNLLFKIHKKIALTVSTFMFVILVLVIIQQINAFRAPIVKAEPIVETAHLSSNIKKYFGEEAKGDLNNDQKEDVAFLIKRKEGNNDGDMYYLTASLKTDQGYQGLNLLYLGQRINIESLIIEEGIISVVYKEFNSEESMVYKVRLEDDMLVEIMDQKPEIEDQVINE